MKVSLNWVKEFTDVQLDVKELVEKIGAQLGEVEETIDLGKLYQGIVIAKVVSCVKHGNSDYLSVCKIDDGGKNATVERDENGLVQVVCGAPNVKEGLTVAWLPPGLTVPSTINKDPLVLEVRDIRGQKSNGMLASLKELAIGDDHSGIVELNPYDGKPGDDFAKAYRLNDYIIDIENKMFTHRPDLFGELGVAREIAGIQSKKFTSPEWYLDPKAPESNQSEAILEYGVTNEIPELCPRYMLIGMDDITIAPSPVWLQTYLSRVGIRPINNIVDITNYIMMLTGQPLHAFDFDKVAKDGSAQITVRKPRANEKMTLLGGKEITPRADAILICDDEKPIALGGIMGGNNSEIDENTKRILIECANFDMYNLRRSSMEHGIFTDAVTRFTKGQSTEQCPAVLYKTVELIQKLCQSAKPIGETVDSNHATKKNQPVDVTPDFINARLGLKLNGEAMTELLTNVEFKVEASGESLQVLAPFWRTDIEIPEDVVEEVGRLYGYDKLPLELPRRDLTPAAKDPMFELKAKLRELLSKAGANEVLTYSFVHGNLMEKVGQNKDNAFQLSNALSPELQYYRQSLIPSLLEKVHPNIKAGFDEFALFEINQTHAKDLIEDGLPVEEYRLGFVIAVDDKLAQQKYAGAAYYEAQKYLTNLLAGLGITDLVFEPTVDYEPKLEVSRAALAPFEKTRTSIVKTANGQFIAELGEFNANVHRNLKLPQFIAGFELDVKQLLKLQSLTAPYVALPRFPKVEQDISLKVAADLPYQDLYKFVWQTIDSTKSEQTYATLKPIDIYQRDDDPEHKQITLRLEIASYEKTMTDGEVNALLDHVAEAAKEKFAAERL